MSLENNKKEDTILDPLGVILRNQFLYLIEKSKEETITPEQLVLLSKTAIELLDIMRFLV